MGGAICHIQIQGKVTTFSKKGLKIWSDRKEKVFGKPISQTLFGCFIYVELAAV